MDSSQEVTKANRAPDRTPGRMQGMVILLKTIQAFAPRLLAACSNLMSKFARLAFTVITTKGIPKIV
jgi:hypothetical protein